MSVLQINKSINMDYRISLTNIILITFEHVSNDFFVSLRVKIARSIIFSFVYKSSFEHLSEASQALGMSLDTLTSSKACSR